MEKNYYLTMLVKIKIFYCLFVTFFFYFVFVIFNYFIHMMFIYYYHYPLGNIDVKFYVFY